MLYPWSFPQPVDPLPPPPLLPDRSMSSAGFRLRERECREADEERSGFSDCITVQCVSGTVLTDFVLVRIESFGSSLAADEEFQGAVAEAEAEAVVLLLPE